MNILHNRVITGNLNTLLPKVKLGITTRHLSRIFSKEFGISPAKWLENIRLEHAKKLLREDQLATKQVVMECGLSNEQVLRQLFVRNLGISPVEYKKLYQYRL
ncbi:helix-turn-helix domain-containing protein [Acinetobacter colistiniresistens]|uniref:helix-turn-helix domain-containing protein n=1 Tax=Acinetobacter colistiniresistens TaxID=280145 RepID=UPI00211D0F54|nr:helix-turn-helix domain-containing protein [Acinetobacter colistiniresistens]UUM26121.1 helix-turn-helix domain-containing protein [Acinetobacter colistiniresistens]